jgi:hypothetical protein
MPQESSKTGRVSGCLVRLFWMGVGNLILVLLVIGIGQNHAGFAMTARDIFYWGTVVCLLAVRYVDIRYLGGETADNRPASMSDWSRYAATVIGASLVLWLGAHAIS